MSRSRTWTVRTALGFPQVSPTKSGRIGGAVKAPTRVHHSIHRRTTQPM